MRRIAALIFVGTLLLGAAVAQTSAASQTNASASQSTSVSADKSGAQVDSKSSARATQSANVSNKGTEAAAASQLKSGSSIHATLEKPVDARKNKSGDQVVAKTSEDVKCNGKVVIPRGSKIVGHVTEVKAHEKGQAESAVGVVFDHAVLKDGSQMPLSLTVQAVRFDAIWLEPPLAKTSTSWSEIEQSPFFVRKTEQKSSYDSRPRNSPLGQSRQKLLIQQSQAGRCFAAMTVWVHLQAEVPPRGSPRETVFR